MGACVCREKKRRGAQFTTAGSNPSDAADSPTRNASLPSHADGFDMLFQRPAVIESLVLQTLRAIRIYVDSEHDTPRPMVVLHHIAEKEAGWICVASCMINVIPLNEPLGPAEIMLLLDECPIPTRDAIHQLVIDQMNRYPPNKIKNNPQQIRNILIVLGFVGEKLAGPVATSLLNDRVLDYIVQCLSPSVEEKQMNLFALIALEKFAQTSENKSFILQRLNQLKRNPVEALENVAFTSQSPWPLREVGFCAQWALDNIFLIEGRTLTYERVNNSRVNVILNDQDVSEYLKISADGLEARCDALSFESVRCTFETRHSGVWYYEAEIITSGVMQIGFATKESKFLNFEGYGIGDDEFSVAYDGCRQLIWHAASPKPHGHPPWKAGDLLGCLLDFEREEIIFSMNGTPLPAHKQVFHNVRGGFFAAASFMSFQQCRFNFGHEPFRFPPQREFQCFNDFTRLQEDAKVILPKHKKMELFRAVSVKEDSCNLCYENAANTVLRPCGHSGFCMTCAMQLSICPLCRHFIDLRDEVNEDEQPSVTTMNLTDASE